MVCDDYCRFRENLSYGHLDFKRVLGYVKKTGYADYASFECLNRPSVETILKETGAWVQSMRELPEA